MNENVGLWLILTFGFQFFRKKECFFKFYKNSILKKKFFTKKTILYFLYNNKKSETTILPYYFCIFATIIILHNLNLFSNLQETFKPRLRFHSSVDNCFFNICIDDNRKKILKKCLKNLF